MSFISIMQLWPGPQSNIILYLHLGFSVREMYTVKMASIGLSAETGGGCQDYALRMMEADSVQLTFLIEKST